jgi:hypothetical protein
MRARSARRKEGGMGKSVRQQARHVVRLTSLLPFAATKVAVARLLALPLPLCFCAQVADSHCPSTRKVPSLFTDAGSQQKPLAGIAKLLTPFSAQLPKLRRPLLQSGDIIRGGHARHAVVP